MKQGTMNILFFVLKTKLLKNGEAPVLMRITINGDYDDVRIQRSVPLNLWNAAKGCSKGRDRASIALNTYIAELHARALEKHKELVLEQALITPKLILKRVFGKDTEMRTLLGTMQDGIKEMETLAGIDYSPVTINRYKNVVKKLQRLIPSYYGKEDNTRNSDIFRQITADTKSMVSQEGNIRAVVEMINTDFKEKNFVGIIQCIEMRIDPSQNKIVNLLKEIRRFNEEFGWDLGQNLFSTAGDDSATREKATTLLRELIKAMDAHSGNLIRLADFFDLKFRVIENRNDTGFVERLTNVGSEGTDILVKSMVNIMLLNVFKRNASTEFSEFKLHCMMDEIGKLHPNNMAGILKFANDRDILLINGSPTEQDALSYKHIYKLEKDNDSFTRIRRVITQFD